MIVFTLFFCCLAGSNFEADNPLAYQDDETESTRVALKGFGVEPSLNGVKKYLQSLVPTEASVENTERLVKLLSHPKFAVREQATQDLMLLPSMDEKLARDLLQSSDPETAHRILAVIEFRSSSISNLQAAVFDFVISNEITGLAEDIIQIQERLIDAVARRKAFKALEVSSRASDYSLIKQSFIKYKTSRDFAGSCLRILDKLNPENTVEVILSQELPSLNDFVKLEAAQILAKNKKSSCLEYYVSLLDSEQRLCRHRAFIQLKLMTEKRFSYSASLTGEGLDESIKQWRNYIKDARNDIEIDYHVSRRLGRLLVCSYSTGEIHSYDENGDLRWSADGPNAFTCQGLPNGNCLVMLYSQGKLREYDENGVLVKELTGLPSTTSGIQRLENGNTILACGQSGNKIIEIDEDGKQVWTTTLNGTPTGAILQENGLILVALYGNSKIVEIDRAGKIQSEIKLDGQPYTVNLTSSDTFLVAFASGGVAEYSRSGKELWKAETLTNAYWADRLDDGTVITADSSGILKIGQHGKVVERNTKFKDYIYISSY